MENCFWLELLDCCETQLPSARGRVASFLLFALHSGSTQYTWGGLQANIFKALVILGSHSFCGGNSKGPDFPLSLARGIEVGSGILVPKIAIPPVTNKQLFPSALLLP